MDAIKVYDYLERARRPVLNAIASLTEEQYRREFGFGLRTIASTVTHIAISEWYYVERLMGRTIAPYAEWPIQYEEPPAFHVMRPMWDEQAARTRAAIAAERDWGRLIEYDGFPDDQGRRFRIRAAAGDFFTQLALHEVHHRAQLLAMLRLMGERARPIQDLDYNAMMFERNPLT